MCFFKKLSELFFLLLQLVALLPSLFLGSLLHVLLKHLLAFLRRQQKVARVKDNLVQLLLPGRKCRHLSTASTMYIHQKLQIYMSHLQTQDSGRTAPVPQIISLQVRLNHILDFNKARNEWVAVTSAGPYANHLHFAPDNHVITSSLKFLQAGCSS